MASYQSVISIATATTAEKGSKFIGIVFPCNNVKKFELQLKEIKKDHTAAVHHCYAYRIGISKQLERANDDGEPSGTAGKPILNQLISANLANVGLVVVRYFGGTLLGTSGLIKAYKNVAKDCIAAASLSALEEKIILQIECAFESMQTIMAAVKKNHYTLLEQEIGLSCKFSIELPKSEETSFRSLLNKDDFMVKD